MNSAIEKRLRALEVRFRIGEAPAAWRYPGQSPITRWKTAQSAGLLMDPETGDAVGLPELARRDPQWAATLQDRRAQVKEIVSVFEGSDGD